LYITGYVKDVASESAKKVSKFKKNGRDAARL